MNWSHPEIGRLLAHLAVIAAAYLLAAYLLRNRKSHIETETEDEHDRRQW